MKLLSRMMGVMLVGLTLVSVGGCGNSDTKVSNPEMKVPDVPPTGKEGRSIPKK